GRRILERIYLHPKDAQASPHVLEIMDQADMIVAGPGDLYSTILPVLVVPEIKRKLLSLHKTKIFIVNVANKPFETRGYKISDFVFAIEKHLGSFPFDKIIVNNNFSLPIPK